MTCVNKMTWHRDCFPLQYYLCHTSPALGIQCYSGLDGTTDVNRYRQTDGDHNTAEPQYSERACSEETDVVMENRSPVSYKVYKPMY